MSEGNLYFFNKPHPTRPIEEKYVTEIEGQRKSFIHQEDALLFLFDNGVSTYKSLTRETSEYKDINKVPTFEFWHIGNRVGYVLYGFEPYVDEMNEIKRRKAFVWRFIGHGRSCFAETKDELEDKILSLISQYTEDFEERGYNIYPFYTRHYREQKVGGHIMKSFIAFDFETANSSRHSICSIGMIFVENGEIVDSVYQLINPGEHFDGYNIAIHGITPDDVKDSPTFDVFYEEIREKIQNKILIAHYLAFDGYALRDNLERYNIQPGSYQLLCSYQLSKKLILGESSYSIKSLCKRFGIKLDKHHHALDDAKACAELTLRLVEEYSLTDFESLYSKTRIKPGEISQGKYHSSLVHKTGTKFDLSNIEVSLDSDENNAFYGKNIVFTGRLNIFTRSEAARLVANKGGKPQNGINRETDYIIVGNFDDVMIKGSKSSKLEKAEKMISEGKELEIISEEDFQKML